MDTTTLRTFIALAQIKNFTKTAQQLFVAQSTVTNRIRDLEMGLGVPLFIRSHKQVDLTPSGQKFLSYAQRFVSLELAALQDIQSSPTYTQKVSIGTTNTIYECHLQRRIRSFLKEKKGVSLHVTIGHTETMMRQLQDGTLDAIFSFSAMFRDGYICQPYRTDSLVLVCQPAIQNTPAASARTTCRKSTTCSVISPSRRRPLHPGPVPAPSPLPPGNRQQHQAAPVRSRRHRLHLPAQEPHRRGPGRKAPAGHSPPRFRAAQGRQLLHHAQPVDRAGRPGRRVTGRPVIWTARR